MPLKPGKSKKTISSNISELSRGPRHKKMEEKYGKAKAQKIDVAIALDKARKAGAKIPKKGKR